MEITLIKKHLYIDHNSDDDLILSYEESAESAIAAYTHKAYDNTNKSLEHAKLLLISDWYNFRENTIALNLSEITTGVKFLLDMEMSVVI